MPDRQRGGVAAATAFYGNKAGGAASAGIKQRKKQRHQPPGGGTGPAISLPSSAKSSTSDVGFKSPRSVALWQQRKLAMAGMVTEVRHWDNTTRPFAKTVSTPAPVQQRDFSKISPYEVQKFEQWHDRHSHLAYPREIPDPMFYRKKGRGPLPVRDDAGEKAARAYGSRHTKKLPGLKPSSKGGRGASYSLSNGNPNTRGRTAFLNAIFQDVGAGDGLWQQANPRALRWLPHELLRAEEFFHLTSTLTNLHFLLKKTQECGVAAVRDDLERTVKAFKSTFRSGRCYELGTPMEMLLDWQARIQSYFHFVESNASELASLPASIFRLGAASPAGGYVHSDVQGAVLQAEHSISVIHTLLDPLQSSDADAVNNIPRLLSARQSLEVIRSHGVWLAMDSTALDRITTAENRADEYIQRVRDRLQEVPEAIDRVGQVLLRGPEGQSEHWEKDVSFASLAKLFGESFFGYEPQEAFACFKVAPAPEGQGCGERDRTLLDQLSEETGFPPECLELTVRDSEASLLLSAPSHHRGSEDIDSFQPPAVRDVARRIMEDACDPDSDLRRGGLVTGGPAPPQFWQEACIYITCTIADMQPERDMLSRFVLPALKLACRRRRLRLSWVMCGKDAPSDLFKNLSWVKTSTLPLPDGRRVPFSLAVLGSKLGWIPGEDMRVETVRREPSYSWILDAPFRNWSLNQIEICQAQLRTKGSRGFMFLRDPTFVDSEAFQQSPLQVQEIFRERSPEANDLDEEFKIHVANCNHLTNQQEDRIFEYKTVFVDGEVHDGSGGVRVAFAGLFSFGLDVYMSLYKMIDSTHPTCLSSQPELVSSAAEDEAAREAQLQMHASSIVQGTRTHFIHQLCGLLFESQDDILLAVNGPTGSGRTAVMANVCLQARLEQARAATYDHKDSFVLAWVIHEPWQTEFDWLHCIASQVCRRAGGAPTDEYVGESSIKSITDAIWDMMSRCINVTLIVDGLSRDEQGLIGHLFNTLQGRSNAEWFGDKEKKASLGRLKVVVSTHGFVSEMHRRVQIIDVPRLSLEERLRICWSYVLESKSDIPTKTFESLCASKSDAAYPRYLKVAMRFLSACQGVFPGQMMAITNDVSQHLSTLYENDVLPFLENQGDVGDVRELLSALVNCKGVLPGEIKWVLQSGGQPGDDGRAGLLVDLLEPFASAHRREVCGCEVEVWMEQILGTMLKRAAERDRLLCYGCKTLQECIARRYNLEVAEIPLHHPTAKALEKAETAAKNRLVHRQLLSEMEVKAGFKQKKDVRATKTTPSVLAPTAIAQDALRDAVLDAVATEVVNAAIWNAQQDCYSDAVVANARRATLE